MACSEKDLLSRATGNSAAALLTALGSLSSKLTSLGYFRRVLNAALKRPVGRVREVKYSGVRRDSANYVCTFVFNAYRKTCFW